METTTPDNSKPQPVALLSRLALQIANNRPGLQTTEFALVAILLAAEMIFAALGKIPPSLATLCAGFEIYGYQYLRNARKGKCEESILNVVDLVAKSTGPAPAPVAILSPDSPVVRIPIEQHPTMSPERLAYFMNENPDVTHVVVPSSALIPKTETPEPKVADAPSPIPGVVGAANAILVGFLIFGLSGCAALTKLQADPRVQFAEMEALQIGAAALARYSNGGNIDSTWGISEAIYAATDTVKAISAAHPDNPNGATAVALAQTIQQYASTKDTRALAGKVAAIITAAKPKTDAQRVAVINGIAEGLQSAATFATASDGKGVTPPQASARTLYDSHAEPVSPLVVTRLN